jgi:ribonuclease HII
MAAADKPVPDFVLERALLARGFRTIAGVDEVGRGPLAGPVCAAAVVLDPANIPEGLNDSKALTIRAREAAFAQIVHRARAVAVAFVTPEEIDATDIRRAALLAMSQAVSSLALAPCYVLVDGRDLPEMRCPGEALVKGDALSQSIAAASIVAKVSRDALMRTLADRHPDYGFETNAGYGSARHLEALARLGPTPCHRMSFSPMRLNAASAGALSEES